ncbi:MAG: hypothetical protein EBS32_08240 [Actinobacteria bacterium]|nr:hypothetical protein [Actinomycetota bacterium]
MAFVVHGNTPGLLEWTIAAGRDATVSIDGIVTHLVADDPGVEGSDAIGPTVGVRLDHVVINTNDGERTSTAIESVLGVPLKRVRDAGRGVSQRFHTLDNTVLEIVSGPHVTGEGSSLWGMVLSVADIDALFGYLGPDVLSPPKQAVQAGRMISTVRGAAGLGVPFAVMTPHVRASDAD